MMLRAVNKKGEKVLEMKDDGKIKVSEQKLKEAIKEKGQGAALEEKGDEKDE